MPALAVGSVRLWIQPTTDEKAPVDFLKPRDRRRLSPLGRAALCVLEPFFQNLDAERDAVVFASRAGDLPLTVQLLESIGDPDGLSPTAFSTSVHNAIGGLFTILSGFQGHVTAIGGGAATFSAALSEAASLLTAFERVIVCIYEAAPPQAFMSTLPDARTFAYAFEAHRPRAGERAISPAHAPSAAVEPEPYDASAPLAALDLLEGRTDVFEEAADGVLRRWTASEVRP